MDIIPPPKLKAACTKALEIPFIPLLKAPGFFQYRNSIGPFVAGIPPDVMMNIKNIIKTIATHFTKDI